MSDHRKAGSRFPKLTAETGDRFGRLTVIGQAERHPQSLATQVLCRCDCGAEKVCVLCKIRDGTTVSCGCHGRSLARRHGESTRTRTRTYQSWASMIQRATNPGNDRWSDYGGRGITVCDRWRNYENFRADMGQRPRGTSLERIDNAKGYEPGNCRWATPMEQQRNNRRNVRLTFNGRTMCASAWAEEMGIKAATLTTRLRRGWSTERALTAGVS